MKARPVDFDIAPGLVDLLFALLGVSLLILAAFAIRMANNSNIPSSISIGIDAAHVSSGDEIIGTARIETTPYGCILARVPGFGKVYSTAKVSYAGESTDCGDQPLYRKNDQRLLQDREVVSSPWKTTDENIHQRFFMIPIAVKKNMKIVIEIQHYDFSATGLNLPASSTEVDPEGRAYLIDSQISTLAHPTRVTTQNHILNVPYSFYIFGSKDNTDAMEHKYQLYPNCIKKIGASGSQPELRWILQVDKNGIIKIADEPECAA